MWALANRVTNTTSITVSPFSDKYVSGKKMKLLPDAVVYLSWNRDLESHVVLPIW